MAHEVLVQAGEDLAIINTHITNARELLGAMKEAGEDTTVQESDLKQLEVRKTKWERMLRSRGVMIPTK